MAEQHQDSQVTVVRNAIIDFLEIMKKEKRTIEQDIRERTENIRSQFLSSGASQFSFQDIDGLAKSYRDEFINFYKNIVHLKLLASASGKIRSAIETGLANAGVVQEEWLEVFNSLQDQITNYDSLEKKVEEYEIKIQEQSDNLARLSDGQTVQMEGYEELQTQFLEKDQIISEKDQEIMNLQEGLSRMENQANTLGVQMLDNSMMIEDLQATIGQKDEEIEMLNNAIREYSEASSDSEVLREQLRQSQLREQELQTQVGSASNDLVDQLQNNLEKTRSEVLDIRRELVAKNEEVHQLKIKQDEFDIKDRRHSEQADALKSENETLRANKSQMEQSLKQLEGDKSDFSKELESSKFELSQTTGKLAETEKALQNIKNQLDRYEGKENLERPLLISRM
ncbi:MAG: hypothetical protein ACXAD7_22790 [Candidatus Kariarchaeaceae archaeon]|jgi:chromosome segregation ATPase